MLNTGNFLDLYDKKAGIVHTEFERVADILEEHIGAEWLGTERVKLIEVPKSSFLFDPYVARTFIKLKVDDLAQAYMVMWRVLYGMW